MSTKNISQIMKILSKIYPSTSKTTLNRMRNKPNPYKILISCLLSLRARDENTEKVSAKLFKIVDTPEKLIKIPIKKLEKIIFSSGHYKKKAATLKHVTGEILGRFKGKVPKTREKLLSIKGIGPKTANIVLAFAYGKNVIPVDVHVHVCSNRLGWVKTKTAEKTEPELEKALPKKYWKEINAILVQFGKDICDTRSPKCSKCPIKKYCPKIGVTICR
ncbi:MAG: endonuclease III [archaeon]